MKRLLRTMLILTLASVAAILITDYVFTSFLVFALISYLWAIVGMVGIFPLCLVLILIPRYRRNIGAAILLGNLISVATLIACVNTSKSVEMIMHV